MPKKSKKSKKNTKNKAVKAKRQLDVRVEGTEYARVTKLLGNGRMTCECFDGPQRLGIVRGSLKRCRIGERDIVLIGLRDFQNDKCDIMIKYDSDEVAILQKMGELPYFEIEEEEDIGDFEFDRGSEEDEKEINLDLI